MSRERVRTAKIATGIAVLPSGIAEHLSDIAEYSAAVALTPMRSLSLRDADGAWVQFIEAPVGRTALLVARVERVGKAPEALTGFTAVRAIRHGELVALGHGELFTAYGPGGDRTALGVRVPDAVGFDWLDRSGVLRLLGSTVSIRAIDMPDPLPITNPHTGA